MMKVVQKIMAKKKDNFNEPGVSIAFLGDSVTQGCFEVYIDSKNDIETRFDKTSAYHNYLAKIFSVLYPNVPINIINAGISGDNAPHALTRLERDVLKYNPDLVVVCFGLNDCGSGLEKINDYTTALSEIFDKISETGSEIIFMTPNMMCQHLSCDIKEEKIKECAKGILKSQNEGVLDAYIDAAKQLCKDKNITVCDCYAKWKTLAACGVDITELLSNKLNHPTREMNWLFAYSLAETILGM